MEMRSGQVGSIIGMEVREMREWVVEKIWAMDVGDLRRKDMEGNEK